MCESEVKFLYCIIEEDLTVDLNVNILEENIALIIHNIEIQIVAAGNLVLQADLLHFQ